MSVLVGGFAVGCFTAWDSANPGGCSLRAAEGNIPAIVPELRDQLETGLKARLPREFEFIDTVVDMVKTERLPLDLVSSTFLWARQKRPYPFPYFERGLRLRAAQRGIKL